MCFYVVFLTFNRVIADFTTLRYMKLKKATQDEIILRLKLAGSVSLTYQHCSDQPTHIKKTLIYGSKRKKIALIYSDKIGSLHRQPTEIALSPTEVTTVNTDTIPLITLPQLKLNELASEST